MKKIIPISLLLIILIIVVASCTTKKPGFIINPSCNPPCLLRITPGFTSALDAQNILSSSSYVDTQSIKGMSTVKELWYPVTFYYYWDFINGSHGKATATSESKIVFVEVENPNITVNQYLRLYGKPSVLLIVPYWGYKAHVYLVYLNSGVILDVYKTLSNNNVINFRSFDQIKSIIYVNTDLLYSTLHYFIYGDTFEAFPYEKIKIIFQPWKGYGKYKLLRFWE